MTAEGLRGDNVLFLFENFALDCERRELRAHGTTIPIEPQVFDLLVYLVKNRDHVVSKDDLIASVWGGRVVSDSTVDSNSSRSPHVATSSMPSCVSSNRASPSRTR